jgi:aminoglycoside 3-N-acetyltransferase I
MGDGMRSMRLQPGDRELARALFALMAEVFDEPREALSDRYLDRLLAREDFWAVAAFDGDQIIGGVTAHSLPMTNTEAVEVFIYDLAVRHDHQRQGVGRHLVTELRNSAAASGIANVFVAADNDDLHALDFYRTLGGRASPVTLFAFSRP